MSCWNRKELSALVFTIAITLLFCFSASAAEIKEGSTIQKYFESSLSKMRVKECSVAEEVNGSWPLKRVFVKVKPQIGIGINNVLSLTAIPEIGFGWEKVSRKEFRHDGRLR
jgi:hypothetical protein